MVVEHCDTTTVTMHAVLQENIIMKAAGYVDNYFIQHVPLTDIEDVFFTKNPVLPRHVNRREDAKPQQSSAPPQMLLGACV